MRRSIAVVSLALASTLVLAACSGSDRVAVSLPSSSAVDLPSSVETQLKDAVTAAMAASGASGAVVGVWAPWSGSWVAGLGTVSPGSKAPVTTKMTFRAGEVTRAMTCDVLYRVVAEGKASLSDSIDDYVGQPSLRDVTLGELCDGTSGMGSYEPQLLGSVLNTPGRSWNPGELVSYGLGLDASPKPGTTYGSSDAGYVLLGQALTKITGESPAVYLRENVFARLGLTSTSLAGAKASAPVVGRSDPLPGLYSGIGADGKRQCEKPQDVTVMSGSFGSTDAGVVTDIQDLGTYARALAAGSLVSTHKRFADAKPAASGAPSWYTAGGGAYRANTLVGQWGSTPGYMTAAFADPTSGLTVAVVLNNSAADATIVSSLAWELAAIASKAPATTGKTAPESGLPWTAQQYHDAIAAAAICPAG